MGWGECCEKETIYLKNTLHFFSISIALKEDGLIQALHSFSLKLYFRVEEY